MRHMDGATGRRVQRARPLNQVWQFVVGSVLAGTAALWYGGSALLDVASPVPAFGELYAVSGTAVSTLRVRRPAKALAWADFGLRSGPETLTPELRRYDYLTVSLGPDAVQPGDAVTAWLSLTPADAHVAWQVHVAGRPLVTYRQSVAAHRAPLREFDVMARWGMVLGLPLLLWGCASHLAGRRSARLTAGP